MSAPLDLASSVSRAVNSRLGQPSGWRAVRIVLGAGLGMYINLGPVLIYTFGVFLKPISEETGWQRSAISAALGPATFLVGLTGPLVGSQLDRFGARRFVAVSSLLFAAGLALLGFVPSSAAAFTALLTLAMLLGSGMTPLPFSYVVSSWFDARRGLALGLALSSSGIAVGTVPLLAAVLIARFGWRHAYVLLGAMVLTLGVVTALGLLEDAGPDQAKPHATTPVPAGLSLREALASRTFWLLFLALFSVTVAVGAGTVHLPAILADRGAAPGQAALVMSVVGGTMIVGRIGVEALLDRVSAPRLSALVFLAPLFGHVLLLDATYGPRAIAAAAAFGLGLGAELDVFPYMVSKAFGTRHFGQIYGALLIAFSSGLAAGTGLLSALFSMLGRYDHALLLAASAALLASTSLLLIPRRSFEDASWRSLTQCRLASTADRKVVLDATASLRRE